MLVYASLCITFWLGVLVGFVLGRRSSREVGAVHEIGSTVPAFVPGRYSKGGRNPGPRTPRPEHPPPPMGLPGWVTYMPESERRTPWLPQPGGQLKP
jgi:hypothetical protein